MNEDKYRNGWPSSSDSASHEKYRPGWPLGGPDPYGYRKPNVQLRTWTPPPYQWELEFSPGNKLMLTKAPNAFHRWTQKMVFGFKYRKLV